MPSKDIARFLFQPQKRYSSLRMQQGRVPLESDWNESERIDDEEARRVTHELVGPFGTPNDGFLVQNPHAATATVSGAPVATYDFDYHDGSYYVGGLRFECQTGKGETFLAQPDWLQLDALAANLPPMPTIAELTARPDHTRSDFVYLHGWEQPVTQVEDSELIERALGGPDTSVRIRRMRRLEVLVDATDCVAGYDKLIAALTAPQPPDAGAPHGFDRGSGELTGKARLTVAPVDDGAPDDPCRPAVRGGFLGAENEALRVELTATDRFIWGRDNAAPLYRVTVERVNGSATRIRFLTTPRDQPSRPLKGQAVEIHPWGALLPNQEKVAEIRGHISRVAVSYTPDRGGDFIDLELPVPDALLAWLDAHPQDYNPSDATQKYFYLRLWTGASAAPDGPTTGFTPGTAVTLGTTGLQVTFSDYGLPGAHFIIAARPHTPRIVVPWELMSAAPPAGLRHFYAPLATIHWALQGTQIVGTVEDCRTLFPPLVAVRGCCTVTVGDGVHSIGDVTTIADALALLPPDGGRICLLKGTFRERIDLTDRSNVTVEGCGVNSILTNPPNEPGYSGNGFPPYPDPLIILNGAAGIELRDFTINAIGVTGIGLASGAKNQARLAVSGLAVSRLDINCLGGDAQAVIPMSAIDVGPVLDCRIERCHIETENRRSPFSAIKVSGQLIRILENVMNVDNPVFQNPPQKSKLPLAWAGLQIAGGSQDTLVRDNEIIGGLGHGITIGDVLYISNADAVKAVIAGAAVETTTLATTLKGALSLPAGHFFLVDDSLCDDVTVDPPPLSPPDGGTLTPIPGDPVLELRILRNRIERHGGSGISSAAFFTTAQMVGTIICEVFDIADNTIITNGIVAPVLSDQSEALFGGIALATAELGTIRGNLILGNGTLGGGPSVGVGVQFGVKSSIDDNQVLENGVRTLSASASTSGTRAGIYFSAALSDAGQTTVPSTTHDWALRAHRNRVVHPLGYALVAGVMGPLSVQENHLESRGILAINQGGAFLRFGAFGRPFEAASVLIVNIGLPTEPTVTAPFAAGIGGGGQILFHGNNVLLFTQHPGGFASSAWIQTVFDAVSLKNNTFRAFMGNAPVQGETQDQFIQKIVNNDPSLATRSFVMFDVVASGTRVQANMNDFLEGGFDAASSLLVIMRVLANPFGCSADFNHASHCIYTVPQNGEKVGNQVAFMFLKCGYAASASSSLIQIIPS